MCAAAGKAIDTAAATPTMAVIKNRFIVLTSRVCDSGPPGATTSRVDLAGITVVSKGLTQLGERLLPPTQGERMGIVLRRKTQA